MNVTEEVTIHRPNVSTLLSSAFIRGDLNAATRGPFIWSLIFSQFLRLRRLCSDDSDFSEKSEAMYQFFDKHDYPVSVVQAGHHRAQKIDLQSVP